MNERIRELAEQAGLEFDNDLALEPEPIYYTTQKDLEKFAELIVAECAAIINDIPSSPQGSWSDGYYEGCTDSAKQIQQHFGVEE